jgi:YcaO-like protein with predicted kinase domain
VEIATCYPIESLRAALIDHDEKIVYRQNGNRSVSGPVFLKRLEKIYPKAGVTRVANISHLAFNGYPVFQGVRPNLSAHWRVGQNSGAQGKGPSDVQAKISAIMESIELYSAEPKNIKLIRNTYDFLRGQHRVIHPREFMPSYGAKAGAANEPIMWSEALHLDSLETVLVPAETVYFPFSGVEFGARSMYTCSSNGLASGATYLEAIIHGLYEVVERHYESSIEGSESKTKIEALFEEEYERIDAVQSQLESDWEIQLYAFFLPGTANVPAVMCSIVGQEDQVARGWGCCLNVDIAIERSISEAFQSLATIYSGSREDMGRIREFPPGLYVRELPERRSLRIKDFKKRAKHKVYNSLLAELKDLVSWIKAQGVTNLCVANLTRVGIDIPVVKVLAPGLSTPFPLRSPKNFDADKIRRFCFSY